MSYNSKIKDSHIDELFEAILELRNLEECYRFFEDICTIKEIKSLAQRLQVAKLLRENKTYVEIEKETGASTATISRINRALNYGAEGYNLILDRLENKKNKKKKIKELLKDTKYEILNGNEDIEISHIAYNSKKVKKGSLFVCIQGLKADGHSFINDAVKNGAVAILVEKELESFPDNVTVIKVNNTRKILAKVSSLFYNEPSKSLNLVGITGTNGKTSTSIFISTILETVGHKVGVIGTINNRIGDKVLTTDAASLTTPESLDLQFLLNQMKNENVNDVVIEVSSIALDQHRVDYCDFEVGVFTNLTQDHLDYHKTMENYKNAKLKLFTKCKFAVINADDIVSEDIIRTSTAKILTYGIKNKADIKAEDIKITANGVSFKVVFKGEEKDVFIKIPGMFTVYNALAAIGVCYCLGLSLDEIVDGLSKIRGVRGRFESIIAKEGYTVIVDYAHTPDALENVLKTIKEFAEGKIITVFGCGGDRDREKRPIMGKVAGKLSDFCILTSDNPRSEDPLKILNDIELGIKETNCLYQKIVDRKEAIHFALKNAKSKDVVLIAGKGHETYQIYKDKVVHFDDIEVVRDFLKK